MIEGNIIWTIFLIVCFINPESSVRVEKREEGSQGSKGLTSSFSRFPVLTSANLSYSVIVGSKVMLECQVDNLGEFVVLWKKGARVLSVGKLLVRKDGKVRVNRDFSLELSEVQETDGGQYSCHLDVYGETQTAVHNLTVLVPPQIHAWERTLEVTAGDDLSIICEATGNPMPRVSWRKYETGRDVKGEKVELTNLTREEGGLYVCTADNGVTAPVERVTRILVRHSPEVRIEETWKPSGESFEVELQCHVTAYPTAKISWYKNGNVKLSTSDEIVIKAIKPKYALKIEKLKSQNFGMYTCRASNDLGTSEAVTEITGKPRPPIFNSEMREIVSGVRRVNISWSCDSREPVSQYQLMYRDNKLQLAAPHKTWDKKIVICDASPSLRHLVPVPNTGPLTQSCWYTMEGLANDTMYDIKLIAVNSHGESQESKVFSFYVTGTPGRRKNGKTDPILKSNGRQGLSESDISPRQLLRESKDLANEAVFWKSSFVVLLSFSVMAVFLK